MKRIVFATDFSPACEAAFPVAETLARQEQARLLILHVVPPGAVPSPCPVLTLWPALDNLQ